MTVYINGRFLSQRRSGMQRWAEELLTALDEMIDQEHALMGAAPIVLRPPGEARAPVWRNIGVREVGRLSGHLWEQIDLLAASRDGLLVNLLSTGPLLHPNQVVTFHDAAVFRRPELFSRSYALLHRWLRPRLARRAKAIITVSAFSAGELSAILGRPRTDFTIIPNAANHVVDLESEPFDREITGARYGLCVGNQTPNKNVEAAVRAFTSLARPDVKLVLVGAGDTEVFGAVRLSDHPNVIRTGYISDETLKSLYEGASFLAFPSRYEGFGIPVLEAMALGCPVIASNAAAIPETAGGAALLADPNDVRQLATHMADVLDQGELSAELRAKGRKRAADFSWSNSATILDSLICRLKTP